MGRIQKGTWMHRQKCRGLTTWGPASGVRGQRTLAVGPQKRGEHLSHRIGVGGTDAVTGGRPASVISVEQEAGEREGWGTGRGMVFKIGRWSSHP